MVLEEYTTKKETTITLTGHSKHGLPVVESSEVISSRLKNTKFLV